MYGYNLGYKLNNQSVKSIQIEIDEADLDELNTYLTTEEGYLMVEMDNISNIFIQED